MRSLKALVVMSALLCISALVMADYVTIPVDPYQSGGQWRYHYIYHVTDHAVNPGWYWEITDLAWIKEVGSAAPESDWQPTWGNTWVRWTYQGAPLAAPDPGQEYSFATFDIASLAPPMPNRPWRESGGDEGTITGPAPEPATMSLLLLGLAAMGGAVRRRRSK